MWQDVEPAIRDWVAEADTLTEQDWQALPSATRVLYEGFKRILAEYDAHVRRPDDASA
jgi:hypothetical protein